MSSKRAPARTLSDADLVAVWNDRPRTVARTWFYAVGNELCKRGLLTGDEYFSGALVDLSAHGIDLGEVTQ